MDRAASAWLILRFVDKQAEFEFVPTKGALELAQARQAIPFVIPGAELSRKEGKVTFDAILEKYGSPAEFMGEIGVSLIVLSLWIYGQHKRCCPQIHRRNNKRKSLESEIEGAIVDVRKN